MYFQNIYSSRQSRIGYIFEAIRFKFVQRSFLFKILTPSARFLCSSSIVLFHLPLRILGEPSHGHTSHERDDDEDNPHEVSIQELAVGASSEYAGKCERTDGADAAYQREC